MICKLCKDRENKCLNCYDMECGIIPLQRKISVAESKLEKQKEQLRLIVKKEAANRAKILNEYFSKPN